MKESFHGEIKSTDLRAISPTELPKHICELLGKTVIFGESSPSSSVIPITGASRTSRILEVREKQ
jgi:hypothetical protein